MTLNDAIDDPAYCMINCAHTSHVASVLDPSSVKLLASRRGEHRRALRTLATAVIWGQGVGRIRRYVQCLR